MNSASPDFQKKEWALRSIKFRRSLADDPRQEACVDIIGGLIQEVATIVGYLLLFTGVYKLFQILTVLGEIKDLLKSQTGTVPPLPVPGAKAALLTDAHSADDAAQYAEKLLRAVNAESHPVPAGGSADLERS